jgi:hypothetical protein
MKILLFSLTLLILRQTHAQQSKYKIADLAFMAGTWQQKHAWGDMEEFWGPPMGDNMACSYRCVKDGKAVFYEFIVIEQTDSVPVMKLRHFNPGNIAWEDKETPGAYPLISCKDNKAVFEALDKKVRLSYIRRDATHMDIELDETNKEGKWEKIVFNYEAR